MTQEMILFFSIVTSLQDTNIADCPIKLQGIVLVLTSNRDEFYKDVWFFTQLKYRFWVLNS